MAIRIGITQRVMEVPVTRERRDALDQRWARVIAQLGAFPVPLSNCVGDVAAYLAALDLAGVILSGGNDVACLEGAQDTAPERDEFEARLVDACLASGTPLVGVCRGMQVLNLHFGGRLQRVEGHVASHHAVRMFGQLYDVNSFHNWGIETAGLVPGLEPIAMAEDGTVEAFAHRSLACCAWMWHPEREPQLRPMDEELLRRIFSLKRTAS